MRHIAFVKYLPLMDDLADLKPDTRSTTNMQLGRKTHPMIAARSLLAYTFNHPAYEIVVSL